MLENTTSSSPPLTPLSSSCHLVCSILPYFSLTSNLITGEYCACDGGGIRTPDLDRVTLLYKIGAIVAILMASALGVSLPIVGKNIPALRAESAVFFLVKAFAAGVILSTGFIHILPDAFEDLTDPSLKDGPWGNFPFAGLAAMVGSLGTLMIDAFATGYYRKLHFGDGGDHHRHGGMDEETSGDHAGHVHLHTHATHGHAHLPFGSGSGGAPPGLGSLDQIRYRITSQVRHG